MRTPVAVAGLLGGLCWLGAFVIDAAGGSSGLVDAVTWAGIALLAIGVLGAGAALVSRSATWLRVLVAVCFTALVWSVLELLRDSLDGLAVYAVSGVLAGVVSVVVLTRSRPPAPEPAGHRAGGAHAR
jgi:hypothetical protein